MDVHELKKELAANFLDTELVEEPDDWERARGIEDYHLKVNNNVRIQLTGNSQGQIIRIHFGESYCDYGTDDVKGVADRIIFEGAASRKLPEGEE